MLKSTSNLRGTLKSLAKSLEQDAFGCGTSGVVSRLCERNVSPSSPVQYAFRQMASDSSLASTSYAPAVGLGRLRELGGIYKQLSKFRLSCLVVTTASAGFVAGKKRKLFYLISGTYWKL
jgi:hypothetical protein